MSRFALIGALIFVGACRCKPENQAKSPVTDAELKALLAQKPNDGCTTFQVVDGPDGKKALECVQMAPADSGR